MVAFQTRNPHAPCPLRADPAGGQGGGGQPPHPSRRRHDQAGRRRPLHPGPLLPGGAGRLPPAHRDAVAATARHAHGRARARRCWHAIIRQEPRLHPPHRRAATTPGPATTPRASRSTAPTTPRSSSASTRPSSGVTMVPFQQMVYVERPGRLPARGRGPEAAPGRSTSRAPSCAAGSTRDATCPSWFTFPDGGRPSCGAATRPAHRQGFTVFFTGLSGSGKSTIANVLLVKLLEMGGRPVTLLDGDIVRKHLSSELGFSKEHRDINIRRIGFVASEITKNGGIAICAPIAPYDADPQGGAGHGRARRRLPARPRATADRGVRGSGTARASTPRPAPGSLQGVHRHLRSLRGARRRRRDHRHDRSSRPRRPPSRSSCTWNRRATSEPRARADPRHQTVRAGTVQMRFGRVRCAVPA